MNDPKTNDAISRSALLDRLKMLRRNYTLKAGYHDAMTDAIGEVRDTPAIDAVPVVRCKECALHGHCAVEDMFTFSGFTDGYCRAGKRVSNAVSGARMDGEDR